MEWELTGATSMLRAWECKQRNGDCMSQRMNWDSLECRVVLHDAFTKLEFTVSSWVQIELGKRNTVPADATTESILPYESITLLKAC